jgi:hypothetical protein
MKTYEHILFNTGKLPYWAYFAHVRARPWKKSSLPLADFVKTGPIISAGGKHLWNFFYN